MLQLALLPYIAMTVLSTALPAAPKSWPSLPAAAVTKTVLLLRFLPAYCTPVGNLTTESSSRQAYDAMATACRDHCVALPAPPQVPTLPAAAVNSSPLRIRSASCRPKWEHK